MIAKVPDTARAFWAEFKRSGAAGADPDSRFYEAFHFDDNEPSANELGALVLAGTKRATASLLHSYETEGKPLPRPGDLSVVTDWDGKPLCVMETRRVDLVPYEDVDEEFAATEGEGDGSLRYWRDVHSAYFGRECERVGCERTPRMAIVCERFEVVWRPA
jgi:uncharacterized protein YhfF